MKDCNKIYLKKGKIIKFGVHFFLNTYIKASKDFIVRAPVVGKVDNSIPRINHYPADSVVCFVNIHPLDSDLSGG